MSASSGSGVEFWCVALPNKQDESATLKEINQSLCTSDDLAEVFHFDIPSLRVGTLERLMNSGDQLAKADLAIEGVIRKIERQFNEVNLNNEALTVDGLPVIKYLQSFRWNAAKYQATRPIEELTKAITGNCQKIEDELKEASAVYQEKKQAYSALQRKKGGNLMVADLNDVLTDNVVKKEMFIDTEYLTTTVVIVPKQSENEFISKYERIASDVVGYGPANNRQQVLGSPVVPRSAIKVAEDREGFCLYLVTVLKLYVEQFKNAALLHRYLVRPFTYNPTASTEHQESVANLEMENEQARNQLAKWCKTHYGETFMAWVHIKAVRVFVESVLRFGLPVDFSAVLIKPKRSTNDKKIRTKLATLYSNLSGNSGNDDQFKASGDSRDEYYPYVSYLIQPQQAQGN